MVKYKDPKSLFELASYATGNHIGSLTVSVLKKFHDHVENKIPEENRNIQIFIEETIEYYDTYIPQSLHNIVTFYSLRHLVSYFETNSLDFSEIKFPGILDIVIRSHITNFDFSEWPSGIRKYLFNSLARMKNLKHLCIFGIGSEYKISECNTAIEDMKNLRSFVCDICDDSMLEVLCKNCPLQNLDIRYSYLAGDCSVSSLLKMQSLKTLQISDLFSVDACKSILLGLPNLLSISYKWLNIVLAQIAQTAVLSLQYIDYQCFFSLDVKNLISLCPGIRKLHVCSFPNIYGVHFSYVATLENLASLALTDCVSFYTSGIKFILELQGFQITELEFKNVGEISMKALNEISTLCPNLITLNFINLQVYKEPALPTQNKILFPKLQYLCCDIHGCSNHHSILLLFLRNCINIKTVTYNFLRGIDDKDFQDIFLYNQLEHLEEVMFSISALTVESVYKLISSCNKLKWIGYLKHWGNITDSEIEQLHEYVRDNNLDVVLLDDLKDKQKKQISVMKSLGHEFPVMKQFH